MACSIIQGFIEPKRKFITATIAGIGYSDSKSFRLWNLEQIKQFDISGCYFNGEDKKMYKLTESLRPSNYIKVIIATAFCHNNRIFPFSIYRVSVCFNYI